MLFVHFILSVVFFHDYVNYIPYCGADTMYLKQI